MISSLVFFVEQIAFGLYILSAGGILFMAYRLQRARRELGVSQFKLEREHALVRQASAVTLGGLLIEFVIGVWAVANLMAPTLRDMSLGTADRRLNSKNLSPARPRPIRRWRWVGAARQGNRSTFLPRLCRLPHPWAPLSPMPRRSWAARVKAPGFIFRATGSCSTRPPPIIGTATTSNFAFYRFEIKSQDNPGAEFAPIGGDNTVPVTEGPLGEILPFNFANGEYRFRLVVFDNTTMLRASCEITIHISDPPPTPTPIGGTETEERIRGVSRFAPTKTCCLIRATRPAAARGGIFRAYQYRAECCRC